MPTTTNRNQFARWVAAVVGLLVVAGAFAGIVVYRGAPDSAAESPQVRQRTLVAEEVDWEIQSGITVKAWTYNGAMPGPEIRVREGDTVRITLVNKLPVSTTLHWHGCRCSQ